MVSGKIHNPLGQSQSNLQIMVKNKAGTTKINEYKTTKHSRRTIIPSIVRESLLNNIISEVMKNPNKKALRAASNGNLYLFLSGFLIHFLWSEYPVSYSVWNASNAGHLIRHWFNIDITIYSVKLLKCVFQNNNLAPAFYQSECG